MSYTPATYAKALVDSLKNKSEQQQRLIMRRFVEMLERQRALGLKNRIILHIKNGLRVEQMKQTARVITAISLSAQEQKDLQEHFQADTHTFSVRPELLGGLVVQHGTRLYQATLKKALERISKN